MNKNTDKLLMSIEEQINKVIFSCMIIGRFPSSWSFDAYNSYLRERGISLRCCIVRFEQYRLMESVRFAVDEELSKKFPNICVKTYDTYLVYLSFEKNKKRTFEAKKFCDVLKTIIKDNTIVCFSSDDITDVSCLVQTYSNLKKSADTELSFAGKFRDEEVVGLYALEKELFEKIETGCVTEITSVLTAIVENVEEANSIFLTDGDDIIICTRNYFAFLWREVTRIIYERTGKRKTIREFITIDLDINMANDTDELVNLMVNFIEKLIEELALTDRSSFHRIIENVKEYVCDNYTDDVSLKHVAEQVGLSSYYLSKLFKKVEGVNFKDYVVATRMEKAKVLMSEGNMNVNEIAEAVGYSNANYFSTAFHRYFGTTAKECITWRKEPDGKDTSQFQFKMKVNG